MDHIKDALKLLKDETKEHWNEAGGPSLAAVIALAKDATITQEQLDSVAGDLKRKGTPKPAPLKTKIDDSNPNRKVLENVLVEATATGYYGNKYREVGEKFVFTGVKGSWMKIAKKDKDKSEDSE